MTNRNKAQTPTEDINQPPTELLTDEVPDSMHPVLEFITENIKTITGVVILLLLAVAGTGYYQASQTKNIEGLTDKIGQITRITDPKKRLEELATLKPSIPSALELSLLLETAKAQMEDAQYQKAADTWNEISKKEENSMFFAAKIGQVKALLEDKQDTQALEILEKIKDSSPDNYKYIILNHIARISEDSKNYTKALATYQQLEKLSAANNKSYLEHKIKTLENEVNKQSQAK